MLGPHARVEDADEDVLTGRRLPAERRPDVVRAVSVCGWASLSFMTATTPGIRRRSPIRFAGTRIAAPPNAIWKVRPSWTPAIRARIEDRISFWRAAT
jgi:hypothetical protein